MRRSKHFLLGWCLFLMAFSTGAQTALDNYLREAAESNPGLKADFGEYLAAVERVPQVGTLPDPTAAFGYFASPTETRVGPIRAKISLAQKFPWFGLLQAREDVAAARASAVLEQFEENKAKLFFDLKTTYYDLYFVARALKTTEENVAILETFKRLALIKLESGQASAVQELRVEIDQADLQNEIAYLRDQYYQLQVQFNKRAGTDAERSLLLPSTLEEVLLMEDREVLFEGILEGNHSLRRLESRILSLEHQKTVARKEGKVDFTVGFDYSFVGGSRMPLGDPSDSGEDSIVFPKVGLSIPLFRKKYRAMVAEASARASAAGYQKADRKNELRILFERAYREYRDGARRIVLFGNQSRIADQALDLLLAEYTTDGIGFEEVLRMERRLLGYELAIHRANSDRNAAAAFIHFLMGS